MTAVSPVPGAAGEAKPEVRFRFGQNWRKFLRTVDAETVGAAARSLQDLLNLSSLEGSRFLDIGAGSGLFSLAAARLGAEVHSFDADDDCVQCVRKLRSSFEAPEKWRIEQASVLDEDYIMALDKSDVVYAWGVLHHTGRMWQALENAATPVKPGGKLVVAIYNDQGWRSRYWGFVKSWYNRSTILKYLLIAVHAPYFVVLRYLVRKLSGKGKLERGMSLWYDMLDWLGGYPFEVAIPEDIVSFYVSRKFALTKLRTCGGRSGCNEYVFVRTLPGAGA